jgi:ankyrin repeat protein
MDDDTLSSSAIENNMHAIISCAAQGDIIALHKLVIEKIQWNVQTSRGDNAMHVAAKFGRYEFIHELIKLNFPLNV